MTLAHTDRLHRLEPFDSQWTNDPQSAGRGPGTPDGNDDTSRGDRR